LNKKGRQPKLSAEDIALFRREAGPVKPLRPSNRAEVPAKRSIPPSSAPQLQGDQTQNPDAMFSDFEADTPAMGDELSFLRPGVQRTQLRKLRKGAYPIRSELDLHGMTTDEARQQLAIFLQECLQRDERCVRVIHGKGYRSRDQQPILKSKLNQWLPQCPQVLAFCSAPAADGGTGALYILLTTR
jgi:DNA-nicking Smr family endonuclease